MVGTFYVHYRLPLSGAGVDGVDSVRRAASTPPFFASGARSTPTLTPTPTFNPTPTPPLLPLPLPLPLPSPLPPNTLTLICHPAQHCLPCTYCAGVITGTTTRVRCAARGPVRELLGGVHVSQSPTRRHARRVSAHYVCMKLHSTLSTHYYPPQTGGEGRAVCDRDRTSDRSRANPPRGEAPHRRGGRAGATGRRHALHPRPSARDRQGHGWCELTSMYNVSSQHSAVSSQ